MENDAQLRRYLLGELSPDEMEPLEQRLLADGDLHARLLLLEDELIDDYAGGALFLPERQRVENFFLSSEQRREKLRFARAAQRYAAAEPQEQSAAARAPVSVMHLAFGPAYRSLTLAFATLLALAVGVSGWSFVSLRRAADELGRARAALSREQERTAQLESGLRSALAKLPPEGTEYGAGGPRLLAVNLMPGLVRESGGLPRVALRSGVETVELRLGLSGDDFGRYTGDLQTVSGTSVVASQDLSVTATSEGRWAVLRISAEHLRPDDYRVRLFGTNAGQKPEELRSYYFRVTR